MVCRYVQSLSYQNYGAGASGSGASPALMAALPKLPSPLLPTPPHLEAHLKAQLAAKERGKPVMELEAQQQLLEQYNPSKVNSSQVSSSALFTGMSAAQNRSNQTLQHICDILIEWPDQTVEQ